jgi:hypothetical protein
VEAAAPADEAAAPAPKRKYERRPRKEAAAETPDTDEAKAD